METQFITWAIVIIVLFVASSVSLTAGLIRKSESFTKDKLTMFGLIGFGLSNAVTFVVMIYFVIAWIIR